MIIITVKNGLGNQLFIYSFGEYLKFRFPEQNIVFDFSDLPYEINNRKTYKFIDVFNVSFEELTISGVRKFRGKKLYMDRPRSNNLTLYEKIDRKIGNILLCINKVKQISEPDYWEIQDDFISFIKMFKPVPGENYIFDGFWENMDYILPIRHKLVENIKFKNNIANKIESKLILNNESVSVHLRRGDYIKESLQEKYPKTFYALCDEEYYKKSIDIIKSNIKEPFFVFFSDEPDFVNSYFKELKNKIVIRGNKDYEDLQLMALCKHNIIANSTFSFWGAFLNKNKGMVIAPRLHYIRMDINQNISKEFFKVPGWIYVGNNVKL